MEELTDRVQLCPDGKYRWIYEVNLYKNPSMFYDLMKVVGISLGFVFAIMIFTLIYDGIDWDSLMNDLWGFMWVSLGFIVLCLIGYLIWVRLSGGRYAAMFEMDEESVMHMQMPKTVKRGQVIGEIASLVGMAGGNLSTTGAGLLAASVNAWKSDFKTVRRVLPKRRRHLIKVNELFTKNRIYVENKEDYEFVLDFIYQRCTRVASGK